MSMSRRGFLEDILAAGVLTGAISSTAAGHALRDELLYAFTEQTSDAHDFWRGYFDSVMTTRRGGGSGKLEAQDRKVQYLHVSPTAGVRYLNDIKPDELLDYDGDVLVSANLGQFRPSAEDRQLLQNVKSSSLRIDFIQTKPFMNVLAPMAWAALAIFEHGKANKLPTLPQLGYQKFMDGKVLLPGGSAKFALNVYPVKPESTLHKILRTVLQDTMAIAPVLSLPAISLPVLRAITDIYMGPKDEMSHGKPLLNSLPATWCATQQGYSDADAIDKFALMEGNYMMVPQAHAEELGNTLSSLEWQRGFLVAKNASTTASPDQRALDAIPGVTYVTLSLKLTKVPAAIPGQRIAGDETPGASPASTPARPAAAGGTRPRPTPTPVKKPEEL
jgi:hypothetical protein